jgi:hypothetical protein
VTSGG